MIRPFDVELIVAFVLLVVGLTLLFGPWVMVGAGVVWLLGNAVA